MPEYELLDFGDARKLERFGAYIVDRPCPTAEGIPRAHPERWEQAFGRYDHTDGGAMRWTPSDSAKWAAPPWRFRQHEPFRLDLALAPLPSGQVGVFPEQTENWAWIFRRVAAADGTLRVLHLFGYTGASTIAAAAAGAEVTHVDAAESVVARARGNAASTGLAEAPIRWIVDDALKFTRRELRRGRRYDGIILDPPTYGHGKKGEVWQIRRDLPTLLNVCAELTGPRPALLLLTCHTTGIDATRLKAFVAESGILVRGTGVTMQTGETYLRTSDGRQLPSGVFVRTSTLP